MQGAKSQGGARQPVSRIQPLYHQVYVQLRAGLLDGGWDAAEPLPSEPALARRFGVSRVTIRKTLEQLQKDGLVVRIQGKGTFFSPIVSPHEKRNISSVLDNLLSLEKSTTARCIGWEMVTLDADRAASLQSQRCLHIRRVRSAEGRPFSLTSLYVPERWADRLDEAGAGDEPVVRLLEKKGVIAERAEQSITAIPADADAVEALGVAAGAPLILMRRIMYDAAKQPILRQESAYPPDRFEYRMTLSRQSVGPVAQWTPIA